MNKSVKNNLITEMQRYDDIGIQGKMFRASMTLTDAEIKLGDGFRNDRIKDMLTRQLVDALIDHNVIEFTYITDPLTFHVKVNARLFVTSNDQVQILRKVKATS